MFEVPVHTNSSVTKIQNLSNLRGQLNGEAARAIAGFQLITTSYDHFVDLLKEHFGQIIGGDGRANSPSHSAKFGSYSVA